LGGIAAMLVRSFPGAEVKSLQKELMKNMSTLR